MASILNVDRINNAAGTNALAIDSSGNITFSNGLYLGGTTSLNLLSDYETGTWTGSILGSATNPTTAVTQSGTYVKIGKSVHVEITFSNFATTGATGILLISGLPFTTNGTHNNGNAMFHNIALNTSASNIAPYVNPTTSNVEFYQSLNTSGWAGVSHHTGGGNRYLWMGLTYATDA